MKTQVVVIHGGDPFNTYEEYIEHLQKKELNLERIKRKDWKTDFEKELGENYEVLALTMPNKQNAKYFEWKIWFEKLIPLLNGEVILVGHSLGGIFLTKYLSENTFPKKVLGTFLAAAPFDEADADYTLGDFVLTNTLEKFGEQGGKITFYQSKDDAVMPYVNVEKYLKLLPKARAVIFENRGHIGQEDFPELVRDIQSLF